MYPGCILNDFVTAGAKDAENANGYVLHMYYVEVVYSFILL